MIPEAANGGETIKSRLSDALFTSFVAIALALALWQSKDFGYRAGLFPWAIGLPVLALAIAQLILELTGKTYRKLAGEDAERDLSKEEIRSRTRSIVGWIVGILVVIWLLGFTLAVPLTTLLYLKITGREKWPITIVFALTSWAFFYGLFELAVNIPFPEGQPFHMAKIVRGGDNAGTS